MKLEKLSGKDILSPQKRLQLQAVDKPTKNQLNEKTAQN